MIAAADLGARGPFGDLAGGTFDRGGVDRLVAAMRVFVLPTPRRIGNLLSRWIGVMTGR